MNYIYLRLILILLNYLQDMQQMKSVSLNEKE